MHVEIVCCLLVYSVWNASCLLRPTHTEGSCGKNASEGDSCTDGSRFGSPDVDG